MFVGVSSRTSGHRLRALAGVGVFVTSVVARPQVGADALPAELRVIAAANRENSARLQTVQFSGQVVFTGRKHGVHWDPIANRTYNSTTRTFSVWRDAANCRLDWTDDHAIGSLTGEVSYNLPLYKHIMSYKKLEREGGISELNRRYGTPQTTTRLIVTPTESLKHCPERNSLAIDEPRLADELEERSEVRFSKNKVIGPGTMAELVDRWVELAEQGHQRSYAITHLGEGRYNIHWTHWSSATAGHDATGAQQSAGDLVVDLDQGANVLSSVASTNGRVEQQCRFAYAQVGGAWILVHAEITRGLDSDGVPDYSAVYDVTPESVRVNEPIDPYVFTFEALEVPRGTVVFDHKTREEYLYDDVPIDVKIALAIEKEHAEEQAEAAAHPAAVPRPGMPEQPVQYAPPTRNEPALHSAHRPDAGAPLAGTAAPTPPAKETPAPEAPRGPSALKMTTPGSRPATQPAVAPQPPRPATRPGTTHVLTPDKAPGPEAAPARLAPPAPASPAKPATGSRISRTVLTTAVVSAGCVAAFAIALRKLAQRGVRPR